MFAQKQTDPSTFAIHRSTVRALQSLNFFHIQSEEAENFCLDPPVVSLKTAKKTPRGRPLRPSGGAVREKGAADTQSERRRSRNCREEKRRRTSPQPHPRARGQLDPDQAWA
jgi:hypothetical protein